MSVIFFFWGGYFGAYEKLVHDVVVFFSLFFSSKVGQESLGVERMPMCKSFKRDLLAEPYPKQNLLEKGNIFQTFAVPEQGICVVPLEEHGPWPISSKPRPSSFNLKVPMRFGDPVHSSFCFEEGTN